MVKKLGLVRYAVYARCSSDDQAHRDFSTVDVQEGLNGEHIRGRGGLFAGSYRDEGVSGTTLKRKGFQRMLADAQAGKFDAVVVTYMSRLGRGDMFTVAEYLLKEAGVKVETVKETFTDDMSGHVNKKMTQFVDGMYVEQVRGWTRTKMEAMVSAGFFPGGYPPFGMRKVIAAEAAHFHKPDREPPKRLIPDPEAAPVVRQAFALYLETRQQAKVAEYLSAVTPRKWTATTVKALLTNETYRGILQFGDWRNEAAWTPVVDPETWEAVQAALAAPGWRSGRSDVEDPYVYYLRGSVRCPHCNRPCTQSGAHGRVKKVHYYVCRSTNRREACPVGRMNADRLHYTVLRYLQHASSHWTFMRRLIAQSGGWGSADEAQKALRGQLGKQKQVLEMRIVNYVKVVGDGRSSPALMAALDRAEAEKEAVCLQIEGADAEIARAKVTRPTTAQVQEAWGEVLRVWEVLTEEERADLLSAVVPVVEMTNKESVTLELLPMSRPAMLHSERFGLNAGMGAGVGLEPTTYGL